MKSPFKRSADAFQTHTTEGLIPHLRVELASGSIIYAPVSVTGKRTKGGMKVIPRRDSSGRLLYAMPGGTTVTNPSD